MKLIPLRRDLLLNEDAIVKIVPVWVERREKQPINSVQGPTVSLGWDLTELQIHLVTGEKIASKDSDEVTAWVKTFSLHLMPPPNTPPQPYGDNR